MAAARLLVVGYLSIDTVRQPDGRAHRQPGGAALYAALGAVRTGAAADLAASVGEDFPTEWLDALTYAGVGTHHLDRKAAPSRCARIIYAADSGRRSAHFDAPAWWAASRLHAPRAPQDLAPYGLVVAGPMPAASLEDLLDRADAAGLPVVADINEVSAGAERAAILALLQHLALFAPSREETRLLLPDLADDEAARRLARLGPAVVQKRGADGVFVVEAGGNAAWPLPARPAPVIDPTGAGDATVGALAAARLAGRHLLEAVEIALGIGALAVAGHGPVALCPTLEPVSIIPNGQGGAAR